jgi:hypothetical protein
LVSRNTIEDLDSQVFKIVAEMGRVSVFGRRFVSSHLILYDFHKLDITTRVNDIRLEAEYRKSPRIRDEGDVLIIGDKRSIGFEKYFVEDLEKIGDYVKGYSKPLSINIDTDDHVKLVINDKYIYEGGRVELSYEGVVDSFANILMYPFIVLWIMIGEGFINAGRSNGKIKVVITGKPRSPL